MNAFCRASIVTVGIGCFCTRCDEEDRVSGEDCVIDGWGAPPVRLRSKTIVDVNELREIFRTDSSLGA